MNSPAQDRRMEQSGSGYQLAGIWGGGIHITPGWTNRYETLGYAIKHLDNV